MAATRRGRRGYHRPRLGGPDLLVLLCLLPPGASPLETPEAEDVSIELLEFLGAWTTEDGRWFEPTPRDGTGPLPARPRRSEGEDAGDD